MKIGVLSDTHIPHAARELPRRVYELLAATDVIIHAGDYQDVGVVERLQSLAAFHGVCGNMDPPAIRSMLPDKKIVRLADVSIGIMHGGGSPRGLEERIFREFAGETIDVLIYGHSHSPANHTEHGVLFFNPGSPTDSRFAPFRSVGILSLGKTITGEIIKL